MNQEQQRRLMNISREAAEKFDMKNAIKMVPDERENKAREKAAWLNKKANLSTNNPWNVKQNERIQRFTQQILNDKPNMVEQRDEKKIREYDKYITGKIQSDIRSGRLPDPKKERFLRR